MFAQTAKSVGNNSWLYMFLKIQIYIYTFLNIAALNLVHPTTYCKNYSSLIVPSYKNLSDAHDRHIGVKVYDK